MHILDAVSDIADPEIQKRFLDAEERGQFLDIEKLILLNAVVCVNRGTMFDHLLDDNDVMGSCTAFRMFMFVKKQQEKLY